MSFTNHVVPLLEENGGSKDGYAKNDFADEVDGDGQIDALQDIVRLLKTNLLYCILS
jgi:hypothetical protein